MTDLPDWTRRVQLSASVKVEGAIYATDTGTSATVIAATAGKRIVLDAVTFSPVVVNGGNPGEELRDWAYLRISDVTSGTYLAGGALSPATPVCYVPVNPGTARGGVGQAVQLLAVSRPGTGRQYVQYNVAYHLE